MVGIEYINAYIGQTSLNIADLFKARNLDMQRFNNLLMMEKSVGLPCEDPVTLAVNAAKPILDRLTPEEKDSIAMIICGSESGLDFGKSLSTYIHPHLGLKKNCRLFEVKQACYAGTAALQMAASFVVSEAKPQSKVLVISTDIARAAIKNSYAEPSQGVAAVAMLISDTPKILTLDFGANGFYGYDVMDTFRPDAQTETGDPDLSLLSYIECLTGSFQNYIDQTSAVDLLQDFSYFVFHNPFAGMVKGAHRHLIRQFAKLSPEEIEVDFANRVAPSLIYGKQIGNVYSASLYLGLCSLIDNISVTEPKRIGLYSYGSGCSAEFFSGVIDSASRDQLQPMRIGEHISNRYALSMQEYEELLILNSAMSNNLKNNLVNTASFAAIYEKQYQGKNLLTLKSIQDHHREYHWS